MRSLLVVDDSSSIRKIIKVFLTGSPYEVVEAETAERALQLLRLMPFAAVLADFNMPGMNGFDLVRAIRAIDRPELRKIPVVVLTGESGPTLQADGLAAGANAFLRKPISGPDLIAAVNGVLGQGR